MPRVKSTPNTATEVQVPEKRVDNGLVPMVKDGEVIEVHPSCVEAHKKAGWRPVI
jgi:hypothetical protein